VDPLDALLEQRRTLRSLSYLVDTSSHNFIHLFKRQHNYTQTNESVATSNVHVLREKNSRVEET